MTSTNKYKKKLIEVAIPLEAINQGFETMKGGASARSVIVFEQ